MPLAATLHGNFLDGLANGLGSQGNIASWKKKEGEEIAAGDVLCEVETDKVWLACVPTSLHACPPLYQMISAACSELQA